MGSLALGRVIATGSAGCPSLEGFGVGRLIPISHLNWTGCACIWRPTRSPATFSGSLVPTARALHRLH